jgi:hypothetical protein
VDNKPVENSWKQKFVREMIEYWSIVAYLALFLGLFTTYTRLVLRHYSISYAHYGFALLEALVLAKAIMIIDALHWGRKLESKPLVYSTLYKSLIFTFGVMLFTVIEHAIRGYLGHGLSGILEEIGKIDRDVLTSKCLVVYFSFIPFFAFKELGRILGEGKIVYLFFRSGNS